MKCLGITAISVPSERVFSKAGEVLNKKRNRLKGKTVNMLLFLNKNLSIKVSMLNVSVVMLEGSYYRNYMCKLSFFYCLLFLLIILLFISMFYYFTFAIFQCSKVLKLLLMKPLPQYVSEFKINH